MNEEFDFSTGTLSEEMAQYLQMFVDETSDQLDALVEVLLVLETSPDSASDLNEAFRLIHSIKGAAAMMGLDSITLLTHHLENHFERLRSGLQSLNRPMMDLILRCVDFLRDATKKLRDGQRLVSSPELLEELSKQEFGNATENASDSSQPLRTLPEPPTQEIRKETPTESKPPKANDLLIDKRLIVYFDRNIELPELKAELILARVGELAEVIRTSPSLAELSSVLELRTLQIWLRTSHGDEKLRSVAEVVGVELLEIDLVSLDILDQSEAPAPSSDVLVQSAVPTGAVPTASPNAAVASIAPADSIAPIDKIAPTANNDSNDFQAESHTKVAETVRVDIQRLDKLMNLAGELVVNRARFVQLADQMTETFKKTGLLGHLRDLCESLRQNLSTNGRTEQNSNETASLDDKQMELHSNIESLEEQLQVLELGRRSFQQLTEAIDQFSRVSDGIQRGVLDTRMVPIGPLFSRFKRTVRDIAVELNKKVKFELRGEKTELDKRMIDELGDPLVHLVRNAIDHGLESESVRRSRGKPEAGTLTLEAVHSGNHVLIFIRDDGGGINIEKVKNRAIERGLVSSTEAEQLSERQIAQFIWAIGFSTADTVSDISGRGVGMDIVQTRIRELNGTIEVDSTIGKGTTFVIRLPLTLAIIRSLLFKLKHGIFAAPIENVREIVSVRSTNIISVHGRNSIEVRGEFIPLVDIDDIFDWHDARYDYHRNNRVEPEAVGASLSVIILSTINKTMGLLVSELKGCQDIVVKSLDENFTHIRGLAGASILGDGSVCLLLDIVSCIDLAHERLRDRRRVIPLRTEPVS